MYYLLWLEGLVLCGVHDETIPHLELRGLVGVVELLSHVVEIFLDFKVSYMALWLHHPLLGHALVHLEALVGGHVVGVG